MEQLPKAGLSCLIFEVDNVQLDKQAHLEGHFWKNDGPVTEAATYTTSNKHETNIHTLNGIRNRDPSNREAADLRLRPHGHRDRHELITKQLYFLSFIWSQCE